MKKEWYEYLDGDHPEPWYTTFAVILAVGLGISGLIWLTGFLVPELMAEYPVH